MKTKKLFSGILLNLALVLGLMSWMSLTAYAEGETETAQLPTSAGNYILTADVTIGSDWHPVDGITLNLGGHSIKQNGTNHDDGSVIESVVLCHENGVYGVDIPKNVWHRLEAMEPDSVIFECKEGPFVPHEVEGVLNIVKK